MIVAVYECEWTQYRLEERMAFDTLQSLEPVAHRLDESGYPFRHEWRPLGDPTLVYVPPGCTWVRSRGRLFLFHPIAKALDGYAVLHFARGGIFGFRRAAEGSAVTPIANVVERDVPQTSGRMFEGLVGAQEPPKAVEPPPEPVAFAPTPEPAREPVPAGFLF